MENAITSVYKKGFMTVEYFQAAIQHILRMKIN